MNPHDLTVLRDTSNNSVPVTFVARDSSSKLMLYYSPFTTMATPTFLGKNKTIADDVTVGSRVSVLVAASLSATVGFRTVELNDEVFIPLNVGLVAGTLHEGAPVTDSHGDFIGLFTHRNHASGLVPFNGSLTLVAPMPPTQTTTRVP